jgi:hypothetical protein
MNGKQREMENICDLPVDTTLRSSKEADRVGTVNSEDI